MNINVTLSLFWTIYIAVALGGFTWALYPRADEHASGGAYSFPDIFSPLLRLAVIFIVLLIGALGKAILS